MSFSRRRPRPLASVWHNDVDRLPSHGCANLPPDAALFLNVTGRWPRPDHRL